MTDPSNRLGAGHTAELREALDLVHDSSALKVSEVPPWQSIQGFMSAPGKRRSGRARRFRAPLALAATALAAGGLIIVPSNVFGEGGMMGSVAASPWREDTTLGSLSQDTEFLDSLRQWATSYDLADDQLQPKISRDTEKRASNVVIPYASDIGDYRVAVVEGTWGTGPLGLRREWQRMIFTGLRGAPINELTLSSGLSRSEPDRGTVWGVVGPGSFLSDLSEAQTQELGAAVFVLSAEPQPVTLQAPPTIDREGRVTQHTRAVKAENGLAEMALDQAGRYALLPGTVPGGEFAGEFEDFFGDNAPIPASSVRATPARGGPGIAGLGAAGLVDGLEDGLATQTWAAARQPYDQGEFQVLAAESGGTGSADPNRAVTGVLTLPSGARVLAAGHTETDAGQEIGTALDIARLLPAGNRATAGIAWQIEAYVDGEVRARTAAMGPEGTARIEWITADGERRAQPAENTLAVTDRSPIESVRFLDAEGQEIGTAKVLEAAASRYREEGPEDISKPFDRTGAWILPEVQKGLIGF